MNKYKKLLNNTLFFAIGGFASKILVLLLLPLYTNVLSPSEYGISDLFLTTNSLITPIFTLSISSATIRFAMDKAEDKKKVFSDSLIVIHISLVLLVALICLLKTYVSTIIPEEYLPLFCLFYYVSAIQNCVGEYTKAIGKTKLYVMQGIFGTFILMVSNLFTLLVLHLGLYGYFASLIISPLVTTLIMAIKGKLISCESFSFDKELLKRMITYSAPVVLTSLSWWLNTSADKYMILWELNTAENGLYGVAHKIPTILTTFVSFFSSAWILSEIENNDCDDNARYSSIVYDKMNTLIVLSCLLLIGLSEPLGYFLFAKSFYSAWKITPLLLVAALFSSLCGILQATFSARKRTIVLSYSTAIGAVFNILLNFFLIKQIGISGAAISTALSFALILFIRVICIRREIAFEYSRTEAIISYLLLIIAACSMAFMDKYYYIVYSIVSVAIILVQLKNINQLLCLIKKYISKRKRNEL